MIICIHNFKEYFVTYSLFYPPVNKLTWLSTNKFIYEHNTENLLHNNFNINTVTSDLKFIRLIKSLTLPYCRYEKKLPRLGSLKHTNN